MRYFIVADIHGYYDELIKALKSAGFEKDNPEHTFVSLGDLLDRGPNPDGCLRFVNSLERKILIRGNHEDLMEDLLVRKFPQSHDYHNGTVQTIVNIYETNNSNKILKSSDDAFNFMKRYKQWRTYIKSVVDYAEVGDCIFVHGWIPTLLGEYGMNPAVISNWRSSGNCDSWTSARWLNGMECWSNGLIEEGKTICCGHWHTSYGHAILDNKCSEFREDAIFTPFEHEGICALDACTAHSGFINCKVIEV